MIPAQMLGAHPALRATYMSEEKRQQRRRLIREQQAQIEVVNRQRRELTAAINAVDADIEEITSTHIAECKPKQDRLREIQQLQVAEIADRAPKSAELEAERLSLQAEVNRLNDALAEAVRRADDKRTPLIEERDKLTTTANPTVLENELVGLGRPDLLDQLFVAQITAYWSLQRRNLSSAIHAAMEAKRIEAERTGQPRHVIAAHAEAARKFALDLSANVGANGECDRLRAEILAE